MTQDQTKATEQSKESEGDGYTAVVYFHGMGEQRRYEEVSRLVDALDSYAYWASCTENQQLGTLQKIRARLETPRGLQTRDVSYIRTYHAPAGAHTKKELRPFRFYEAYWAPVTAGGCSAWAVIRWLMKQLLTPLVVLRSPWRERQRQRRASLHSLWSDMRYGGYEGFHPSDFAQLLDSYNRFERADSRREFSRGSFGHFQQFLDREDCGDSVRIRLSKLAGLWHRRYKRTELFTLFVLLSLGLILMLGLGGLFLLATRLISFLTEFLPDPLPVITITSIVDFIARGFHFVWTHLLEVAMAVTLLGIARFLRNYLGDVQIWSTYQETDVNNQKRREILDRSVQLMTHVLADPQCQRVVVIAHSLGTAIAIDTLLELGRYNRARNASAPMLGPLELEKLDQVITLGSPIDKIHYFFESRTGSLHRYNRVVEEVRGDIGSIPFTKNRKPHMHWINFWDAGDVISAPLETPSNPIDPWLRVDNVRVQSYRFPDPSKSHSAYFEHSEVIGCMYEIVFHGAHSLRGFNLTAKNEETFEKSLLGPGTRAALPRLVQGVALMVPWIVAAGVLMKVFNSPDYLVELVFLFAVLASAGLVLSWLGSRVRGHLKPFKMRMSGESDA